MSDNQKEKMTMKIKFIDEADLPPLKYPGGESKRVKELREFAAALLANPGKWAAYPSGIGAQSIYSRAGQIKRGQVSSFQGGKFDAKVRDKVLYVKAIEKSVRGTR